MPFQKGHIPYNIDKRLKKICLICKKEFIVNYYRRNSAKYCSNKCFHKARKGIKLSDKIKSHMKGKHLGFKHSPESIIKMKLKIPSGENHYNWKGGRIKHSDGHVLIKSSKHPFAQKNGYIFEHRLVMEKYIGRYLTKNEWIHHRNGDKADNRIENLQLVIKKLHYGKLICPFCNKTFLTR